MTRGEPTDPAGAAPVLRVRDLRELQAQLRKFKDAPQAERDKIKARLRESIADEAVDWGLTVKSVEILRPPVRQVSDSWCTFLPVLSQYSTTAS